MAMSSSGVRVSSSIWREDVVCVFVGASGPAIDEVDLAGVDLAADVVFGPAAVVEGRVDEFDSCDGFAVGWDHPFSAWLHCNKETAALRCQGGGDGQYGDVMGADAARLTALAQVRAARGVLVCGRRGDYSMVGAGRQVGEEALSPPLKGIFVPTPLSQSREGGGAGECYVGLSSSGIAARQRSTRWWMGSGL